MRWRSALSAAQAARPDLLANTFAAQGDRRLGGHQVVEDQKLHKCQRFGSPELGPDRELAEPSGPQVRREMHPVPDRLLDREGVIRVHPSWCAQQPLAPHLAQRQSICSVLDEARQIRMRKTVPEGELAVEMGRILIPPSMCR